MSKGITKILIALDGSEHSMKAAKYGIDIASKFGSEIVLLSVVPSKISHGDSSGMFGFVSESYLKKYKDEAEVWFNQIIQDSMKKENPDGQNRIKTKVVTTPVSIVAAILDYAIKEKVNLIIVGTRGRGGIKRMLLGSVASGVVTYAHCPVMVIK